MKHGIIVFSCRDSILCFSNSTTDMLIPHLDPCLLLHLHIFQTSLFLAYWSCCRECNSSTQHTTGSCKWCLHHRSELNVFWKVSAILVVRLKAQLSGSSSRVPFSIIWNWCHVRIPLNRCWPQISSQRRMEACRQKSTLLMWRNRLRSRKFRRIYSICGLSASYYSILSL